MWNQHFLWVQQASWAEYFIAPGPHLGLSIKAWTPPSPASYSWDYKGTAALPRTAVITLLS